jgi:hypothetical protein
VIVGVRNKALRSRGCDIGVDLRRKVQLDLDRVCEQGKGAHVSLNALQDDRVAIAEVLAEGRGIETAAGKPVDVPVPRVVLPDQARQ